MQRRTSAFRNRVGMTLIELMIVVAIVAILATIGSFAYGRLTRRSRINQATTFFAGVSGTQLTYFDWYGQYCETDTSAPYNGYDPAAANIKGRAFSWATPAAAWRQCGVNTPRNTWFQFVLVAGEPTAGACVNPPNLALEGGGSEVVPACASIAPNGNSVFWYYIVGQADQDGDGFLSAFGSSSTMSQNHWSLSSVELE